MPSRPLSARMDSLSLSFSSKGLRESTYTKIIDTAFHNQPQTSARNLIIDPIDDFFENLRSKDTLCLTFKRAHLLPRDIFNNFWTRRVRLFFFFEIISVDIRFPMDESDGRGSKYVKGRIEFERVRAEGMFAFLTLSRIVSTNEAKDCWWVCNSMFRFLKSEPPLRGMSFCQTSRE